MTAFNFIQPEKTIEVEIRGKSYPVVKAGRGISCLLIGLGTPSFRTLSKEFANIFELYSSDLYWAEGENPIDAPSSLTMETIIDDIKALGKALNLTRYVIFAHSAYGIIALEFSKKYPNEASAIIMVGTPVNSNKDVAQENDYIFHLEADGERKALDAKRREQIAKEDLATLSPSERWIREYAFRDAPRYWHKPDFDCEEMWKGVKLSSLVAHFFNEILPSTDALNNLEKVETPIFLAAGVSDYDCCPWMWEKVRNLPKQFTLSLFNKSGHWPHYEESELFDTRVRAWIESIY